MARRGRSIPARLVIGRKVPAAPAGTAYTLTAPGTASGAAGVASGNFTVTPNGAVTATVTPADGGAGGTFTPSSLSWTSASNSQTFTYTPPSSGSTPGTAVIRTIATTNNAGLTDPASVAYTGIALINCVFMGTSLTAGFNGSDSYPDVQLFGAGGLVYDGKGVGSFGTVASGPILTAWNNFYKGLNGAAAGLRIDQFQSNSGAAIATAYNSSAPANYIVVEGGVNDIANGASESTCLSRMAAFCATQRSLGYKAFVLTVTPANDDPVSGPSFNTVRNAYNVLLRADHGTSFDDLIDVARDARFGQDGQEFNVGNVNWYQPDGIHWASQTLCPAVAGYVAAKLFDWQSGYRFGAGTGGGTGVSGSRIFGGF